ncbi:hypothetical protein [Pedobacter frigiditerrae]|uniref:hypothetical protein n=1 Tax=Pedobacter frigiditerrae TaxID=2530452 RepID=UPI00292D10EE|nr:hypothetical protein [Pedobacter frigiditerrae]
MKKIFTLTVLMICCIITYAQKEIVENIVSIDLPKDMEKLNKQDKSLYFKNHKNTRLIAGDKFNGLTYKFGDILFQINADSGKLENDHVERAKMAQDNLNSQIPGQKYSSELKTINKNKIALFTTEKPEYNYYRIIATNETNNKIIVARMEYKKEDEIKAKKILDYFLKNLKFK